MEDADTENKDQKYIVYIRRDSACTGEPDHLWQIAEGSFLPKVEKRTKLDKLLHYGPSTCCAGEASVCEDCYMYVEEIEPYTKKRALELGLEKE